MFRCQTCEEPKGMGCLPAICEKLRNETNRGSVLRCYKSLRKKRVGMPGLIGGAAVNGEGKGKKLTAR